jgi:hypothetical protein
MPESLQSNIHGPEQPEEVRDEFGRLGRDKLRHASHGGGRYLR